MKKTLFILFTVISLHGYSQTSPIEQIREDSVTGSKNWYSMLTGDTVYYKTTKAYFKLITTNPQVAEVLTEKYAQSIKYVNIAYKGKERKYTIYLPLAMKDEVSNYIETLNVKP